MVVVDEDNPVEMETNQENVESESKISDSENIDKAEIKRETDSPPTELERLKVFTRKVARCAAKSFCETYVHPLVIKNPNTVPSKSENVDIQNQETKRDIFLNAGQKNEEDQAIILNPKQEEEDNDSSPLLSLTETEKENDRQAEIVNSNKKEHILAATVNVIREEQMITIDKRKPSLSFDIANILSYLPCQSLIAVSEEDDEDIEAAANLGLAEPGPCGTTCKCSQPRIKEDETEHFDEEASPIEEL